MKKQSLKLLRRASACMPLALLSAHASPAPSPAAAHGQREAGTWSFHYEHVLGTSLEVKVRAANADDAQRAENAALAEIDRLDGILSAWRSDSEFSRWARTRFEAVPVSPDLYDVLAKFDRWRDKTGSALDPSAEAAVRLWRNAAAEKRTPSDAEIAGTIEAMAQPHWSLDAESHTATHLTDVPLALASFAKSYVTAHAADAAMRAGASGIMLNAGGDVVVRGDLQQVVDIADPRAFAANDLPIDRIAVRNRAVATSGSYQRSVMFASTLPVQSPALALSVRYSHIIDPRSARPTGHIVSSTVISKNPEAAAALATAFSVLNPSESASLAASIPGVDYLLITDDGRQLRSAGWSQYQAPGLKTVAYTFAAPARGGDAGAWNPAYELNIGISLPRIDDPRYRRPYVAVWIEDGNHLPVRMLALWYRKPRFLSELRQWYRDEELRNFSEGTEVLSTVSSATRPPGHYTLTWDGKDNEGKPVKAGRYTVVVEAAREHGSYQVDHKEFNFDGQPQQATMAAGSELGEITLDYRKR